MIAPKKQKTIQQKALQKTVQKAIDDHIVKELLLQAEKDNIGFKLLKSDKADTKNQPKKSQQQASSSKQQ